MEIARTLHSESCVNLARINEMFLRGNLFLGERLLDGRGHGHIRHRCLGRLDVRNHVECRLITGLGHRHFVPRPGDTPFIAAVGVRGIG
jgi:hypothetical protein